MGSRADVLGALLEAERAADQLGEEAYENMVRSAGHVASIVAAEQKARQGAPSAASYQSAKHPRAAKGTVGAGRFIAKGSSGAAVAKVQKALKGQQTGKYDEHTKAAVEAFQRQHGLKVDGVVGAQTAQALLGNRNAQAVTPGALSAADAKALGVTTSRSRSRSGTTRRRAAAAKPRAQVTGEPKPRTPKTAGRVSPSAPTQFGGGEVV